MRKKHPLRILEQEKENIKKIYPIQRIGIFGSLARGEETKRSDVDVLVEFTKPVSFFEFLHLRYELERLFSRRVDMVTKKALKPAIREEILRDVQYA